MYQIETVTDLRQYLVLLGMAKKEDDSTINDHIETIGQSMGLEVDADEIEELFEDHSIELTTEELKHLQNDIEKND